jgi:hypothetical protein
MSDADRASFTSNVVDALDAMVSEMKPIEDTLVAHCRGSDEAIAQWCNEIRDGVSIVRNRAEHASALYRSILARASGADPEPLYSVATLLTREARTIVAMREASYRFDVDRLTGAYANPTIYGFGYLRPAHTLCYWVRREEQVRALLDTGAPAGIAGVETCTN